MRSGFKNSGSEQFQTAFGHVVREYRLKQHFSQEELADKCGLHRTYISFIERGHKSASLRALFAISKALNLKPYILIKEAEQHA